MDKTANTLLKAIQENDSGAVKGLFSKGVREEVGDGKLDQGIEYLHSVLEGDIVSADKVSQMASGANKYGKKQRDLHPIYTVTTTSGVYGLGFIYRVEDSITPDYKGLYQLWMDKESEKEYGYIKDSFMGIYVPRVIDGAERDKPQEYKTNYGTFTVPAGYYKDDSVSTNDISYFTIEQIALSDAVYHYFSVTFADSDFGANDIDAFREYATKELNDRILYGRKLDGFIYYSNSYIKEDPEGKTAQGYPLLTYSIMNGSEDTLVDKYYYIIGDNKYVLVDFAYTTRSPNFEQSDDGKSMLTATESLINSFIWADQ